MEVKKTIWQEFPQQGNISQHNLTSTKDTFSGDCTDASVKTCASFDTKPFSERENRKLYTCLKTALKLENSDKRPKNRLSGRTISRKSSKPGSNVNAGVRIYQPRGRGNLEKESYSPSSLEGESISKHLASSSKKGWGEQACYQCEGIKFIHPLRLHLLKDLLRRNEFMCKVDLKDAYFCVPLQRNHQTFLRFQWKGYIYEFLCPCFGLDQAPRIFTKLLKIPIAVLRRIQIGIIIYLDDKLLMSQTINGLEIARDTLFFLLQSLGFVIYLQKSVQVPLQKIEFLGLEIDSVRMTLTLPQEKVKKLRLKC